MALAARGVVVEKESDKRKGNFDLVWRCVPVLEFICTTAPLLIDNTALLCPNDVFISLSLSQPIFLLYFNFTC